MNFKQNCVAEARKWNREAISSEAKGLFLSSAFCRELRNINMKHARAVK